MLELLALAVKPSLLAILLYCLIIYWLFLGYCDKNFVIVLMAALLVSILLDLMYVLLHLMGRINTSRGKSGGSFLTVIAVCLVVGVALRVVLIVKLIPFRMLPQKP